VGAFRDVAFGDEKAVMLQPSLLLLIQSGHLVSWQILQQRQQPAQQQRQTSPQERKKTALRRSRTDDDLYFFLMHCKRDSVFIHFEETSGLGTPLVRYRHSDWRPMMETVLFTDLGIVVFAMTTSAIALSRFWDLQQQIGDVLTSSTN
jgi:hypothetical protein